MKLKKIVNVFSRIILAILLILVLYVTYCSIFKIYRQAESLQPLVIILGTITGIFLLVKIKKIIEKINSKYINTIAIVLCICFAIGLSIFGSNVTSIPTYDLSELQKQVMDMIVNGNTIDNRYFQIYVNQIPATILIYYIYSLGALLNFDNLKIFATIINSIFIAVTALFTYLSVKKIKGDKVALTTLIFFLINPIFYIYTSYFYTDTLCMPFAAIAMYIFICAIKSPTTKSQVIKLVMVGIILMLGLKIRIVLLFLFIGMILSIAINNKEKVRNRIKSIIALIIGFFIGILIYNLIMSMFIIKSNQDLELPFTHWIMFGVNKESDGGYNSKDFQLSNNGKSISEKKNFDIDTIKNRVKDLKTKGLIELIKIKLARNWSNGDYDYVSKFINVEDINEIYEYVSGNKKIFLLYYLQICKSIILCMLIIAIINKIRNINIKDKNDFIYISLFGAFIFYIIWEALSRYSLSFLPWMIIIFGDAIVCIEKLLDIKKIKINLDGHKNFELNIKGIYKWTTICVFSMTIFIGAINFYQYSVKQSQYWDKRVVQFRVFETNIKYISNKKIEQTFKTSKKFNSIAIMFLKDDNSKSITHYKFILQNDNKEILYEQNFSSNHIINNTYKTFAFNDINPKTEKEYTIKIYSNDAKDSDSIGIASYCLKDYDVYPDGYLSIDEVKVDGDITFKVQNETTRSYTTQRLYIAICLVILGLEIFAFYPYLRKNDKSGIKQGEGDKNE